MMILLNHSVNVPSRSPFFFYIHSCWPVPSSRGTSPLRLTSGLPECVFVGISVWFLPSRLSCPRLSRVPQLLSMSTAARESSSLGTRVCQMDGAGQLWGRLTDLDRQTDRQTDRVVSRQETGRGEKQEEAAAWSARYSVCMDHGR